MTVHVEDGEAMAAHTVVPMEGTTMDEIAMTAIEMDMDVKERIMIGMKVAITVAEATTQDSAPEETITTHTEDTITKKSSRTVVRAGSTRRRRHLQHIRTNLRLSTMLCQSHQSVETTRRAQGTIQHRTARLHQRHQDKARLGSSSWVWMKLTESRRHWAALLKQRLTRYGEHTRQTISK